jgi:hypothetical protein
MLYQAMDFGSAAFNSSQDRWAASVKSRVGLDWTVVVGDTNQVASKARSLPTPEGLRPEKIAWSDDKLMILIEKDKNIVAFETIPTAESPEWKQISTFSFPGQNVYILNKSETLEITEAKENNSTVVEVARVWFTGDRNVVAKIDNFALRGYDLIGSYAFI